MKKYLAASIASLAILQIGCAPQGHNGGAVQAEQESISENDQRLHNLEDRITALNEQVSQLNNRVYEVRTRNGQKTSMTVVPVTPQAPAQNAASVQASNRAFEASQTGAPAQQANAVRAQPAGRKIDPAAKPSPIPKKQPATQPVAKPQPKPAGASGSLGRQEIVAGPQGQIADTPADNLSLPPAELPPAVVQAAQPSSPVTPPAGVSATSNYRGSVQHEAATPPIPVPILPESGLALPPETPTAVSPQTAPTTSQAPEAVPAPATQSAKPVASSLPRGEANAYNAALKAVRSGRTNEGIRMFRDFLQRYPNGKYAANADYWIGECLYQQGKYQDALSQFNTVNNSFPKHHKNADALLKAGLTMNKMGDSAGANEKFRSILANFPNSDAARRVKAMGIR